MGDITKEQAILLKTKKVAELRDIARAFGLKNADDLSKAEILDALLTDDAKEALDGAKDELKKARRIARESRAQAEDGVLPAEEDASGESAAAMERKSRFMDEAPDFLLADSAIGKNGLRFRRAENVEAIPESSFVKADSSRPSFGTDGVARSESAKTERFGNAGGDVTYEESAPRFLQPRKFSSPDDRDAKPYNPDKPRAYEPTEERPEVEGVLEVTDSGYGFLRFDNYRSSDRDVYVSQVQIRRFNLKTGDKVKGIIRKPDAEERFGAILFVHEINGDEPGVAMRRTDFENLTPVYPNEQLRLARGDFSAPLLRSIDLLTPIGKGSRCLIGAPPKTGKTDLLCQIALSVEANYPEVEVIMLLVAERPEEITHLSRQIKGDVISSSFDEPPALQVKLSEIVFERAHRIAEHKKDVLVLVDSIPRLVRAYNYTATPSGRVLAGGLDPVAFLRPKQFFGSARKLEEGGSITVVGVAGTETLSRTDDFILEEFRGTANMEMYLERRFSLHGIMSDIRMDKSMTKKDSLLISPEELAAAKIIRYQASAVGVPETLEKLDILMSKTRDNYELSRIINTRGL